MKSTSYGSILGTFIAYRCSHQISVPFGKAVSEKKIFRKWPIKNKNCLWQLCLLMDQNEMSNLYRGPSIDASYQISYHLAKRFQRKSCFWNRTKRNTNCLWRPCLLTHLNGIRNSHRGHSIDASYQVSVYLAKLCQSRRLFRNWQIGKKNCLWRPCLLTDWDKISNIYRRTFHRCFLPSFGSFGHAVSEEIFRNRRIRNRNCLWWPCLLMDRDRISNLYSGPSIDASYQALVHLAMWF